jgi:hypothetical protein
VGHFVLNVVSQLQLRSILRNQTGIEDWIVEKAHHRRDPGDPKFVYPYNLGWKNNLKQVRQLYIKLYQKVNGLTSCDEVLQ